MILKDPSMALSQLSQNHANRISQLHKADERVLLLETPALFSPYRVQYPFQGIALAYSIRLYAIRLFFDMVILNSIYVDKSSSEALSDTLNHEICHLDDAKRAYVAETFDLSLIHISEPTRPY